MFPEKLSPPQRLITYVKICAQEERETRKHTQKQRTHTQGNVMHEKRVAFFSYLFLTVH